MLQTDINVANFVLNFQNFFRGIKVVIEQIIIIVQPYWLLCFCRHHDCGSVDQNETANSERNFFGAFGEPYGIRNRPSEHDTQSRNRYFRKVHARFRCEQTGDAIYSRKAIPTFIHIVYYNRQRVTALV